MRNTQFVKVTSIIFLTILFSISTIVMATGGQHKGTTKVEIINANKVFMAAFNRGDAAAVAGLYTKDASLMPTHSDFVNGKEAIAMVWQSVFNAGIKQAKLETLEVEGVGNTLYEVGKYTLTVKNGDIADTGKYLVIWKKEGSLWKLHRDIFNSSLPATEK
jgi:uncharacterized protein (TIGR02246 family)